MNDPDAEGLCLVQLNKGACLLVDKSPCLGSLAVMHESKLDDEHCTISIGYGL